MHIMKICFISTFKELTELVIDVAKEVNVDIFIVEAVLEEVLDIIKEVELKGYDVIISRGGTLSLINKNTDIPTVSCDSSVTDIVLAIRKAKDYSNQVGLVAYTPFTYAIDILKKVFEVDIVQGTYRESEDVKKQVERLKSMGIKVVIGGRLTVKYAEEMGVKGVLLETSHETVYQAINSAIHVASVREQETTKTERLKNILHYAYEGIIVVDNDCRIQVCNPVAAKILGVRADNVLGKNAEKEIPIMRAQEVLSTDKLEVDDIEKIGTNTIIANRIPIKIKNETQGAVITFQEVSKIQHLEQKIRSEFYSKGLVAKYRFENFMGSSRACHDIIVKARRFAKSDSTILIIGESGTGKEIIAQSIHNSSARNNGPFVAINCSSIPQTLLESELFGYEEGAFTGAVKGGKIGLFQMAHKGTIFLDEIGEISKELQASLLRVLQEREIRKIGSDRVIPIDVRIIAATNKNLIDASIFREDLYYRLSVLQLRTPALRERKEDIPELFEYFISLYSKDKEIVIDDSLMYKFNEYDWPGNVRELRSFVERLCLLSGDMPVAQIFTDYLLERHCDHFPEDKKSNDYIKINKGTLREMEKQLVREMYYDSGNNATVLAERLNVSRTTVWKKLH